MQDPARKADPAEPRHDRQLAVMLAGVLELERARAQSTLEASGAPRELIEKALRLLRQEPYAETFLSSPFHPCRHLP